MFKNPTPKYLPGFDASDHSYTNDAGVEIPSASFLLSHFGISNFDKARSDVLERACNFGTVVHQTCELIDNGSFDGLEKRNPEWMEKYYPKVQGHCDQWEKFKDDYNIKEFQIIEQPMYSKVWSFAGTMDRYGDGVVWDLKTGAESVAHSLQTALYQILIQENYKEKVKKRCCVYLKNDSYTVKEYKDKSDLSIAKSLCQIHNFKKNNKINMEK